MKERKHFKLNLVSMVVNRPDINNQKGITLIEVMIAMVILGFGLLTIVNLQTSNMSRNMTSKRQSEGYTWAMDKIERLYTEPYDGTGDLALLGDPAIKGDGHSLNAADAAMISPYTMEWDVVPGGIPNSSQVFVTLRWNGSDVANVNFLRNAASF
ncbi:prepilin-type N-terminal cleavage/methylation domain-containing protein [Desulfopila sp. IMCC35008]|uniref:type IV pilus modification PilV family protein n=1 Tax=Desulfopila sp. IMCC35008 TaxID=2653858 RepID=UPI0013D874E9|nr:prepilin-type N-terminal cleavage/methylation domain-containing protein [Desulfopila sp. IMCC35008]